MLNNPINAFIMIAGILNFLGLIGGIGFLVYCGMQLYRNRPLTEEYDVQRCESCRSFVACDELFGGHVPENGCAYYKNKKP